MKRAAFQFSLIVNNGYYELSGGAQQRRTLSYNYVRFLNVVIFDVEMDLTKNIYNKKLMTSKIFTAFPFPVSSLI